MMNSNQVMAWAAGIVDGCGNLIITAEQGPSRMYHTITLVVVTGDAKGVQRLIIASGNGNQSRQHPDAHIWELQGIDAIRGFLSEIWSLLLPETRSRLNMEIKRYRMYAKGQIAS